MDQIAQIKYGTMIGEMLMGTAKYSVNELADAARAQLGTEAETDYDRYARMRGIIRHPGGVLEVPEPPTKLRRISEYLTAQHNEADERDRELKTYYRDGGILVDALIAGDVAAPITKAAIDRLIANYNREHFD